jgi:hypothetical protein
MRSLDSLPPIGAICFTAVLAGLPTTSPPQSYEEIIFLALNWFLHTEAPPPPPSQPQAPAAANLGATSQRGLFTSLFHSGVAPPVFFFQ